MREKAAPQPIDDAPPREPAFPAAATALAAIADAVRAAHAPDRADRAASGTPVDPDQALAALLLLRELRNQLAGWEAGLVETARAAGATWADLARPMGVASRQAAENRYLRLRPAGPVPATGTTGTPGTPASGTTGTTGTTGAERVKAVRDRRAAERTVTAWARADAAGLRILAAQISALTDLAPEALRAQAALRTALATDDAADLVTPLADMRPHLGAGHPDLATRVDALNRHTDQLRHDSARRRT
ncbi:hypothetical protein [Kitasatospora purpeofusca]|uniref:hypothetical protein n=1 Tax=Kitasatospora purpeofusca TaxID=67352 RepID=UPI002A5B0DF4|nr:hypothetical protein [Kitasatospora purpeofusca]MDY0810869.1 hypothetical protein [Kitasatospora purpeofusca]